MVDNLSLEERHKVRQLVINGYERILDDTQIPHLQEEGLFEVIKAFDNVKMVFPVYLDGWSYQDLEKGSQLILRQPPKGLVIRRLVRAQYRHKTYCSCFNKVVDQWENFRRYPLAGYQVEYVKTRLTSLYPETTPMIDEKMVFTPHIWNIFSKARKTYD
jgi:hypothetical protein